MPEFPRYSNAPILFEVAAAVGYAIAEVGRGGYQFVQRKVQRANDAKREKAIATLDARFTAAARWHGWERFTHDTSGEMKIRPVPKSEVEKIVPPKDSV